MRKFTFLLIIAFTLPCIAQGSYPGAFSRDYRLYISKKSELFHSKRNAKGAARIAMYQEGEQSLIWLPTHEEEWIYDNGWNKGGDYYYTYDEQGNKISNIYDDGSSPFKTETTYNEFNYPIFSIDSYTNDGETYINYAKRTIAYDDVVKSVIIDNQSYTWENEDWVLASDGHTYKRNIIRDEQGNITSVEIYSYYLDEYHLQQKSTIGYNEEGIANTWKYEELAYSTSKGLFMKEVYTLKNLEWHTTNGQILVLDDLTAFFSDPNNLLKKATVYSERKLTGYIDASYEDNGDFQYSYTYPTDPYAKETYTHTITDANGSYVEKTIALEDQNGDDELTDDELVYEDELTVTKDQYGRIIFEIAVSDEEILFSGKYEYVYDEEHGSYPVEQIFYDYEFEIEEYITFLKILAKEFTSVSGIDGMEIGNDNTTAPIIYNLQGVRINATETELPAGLYIINRGGKITKEIKR